MNKNFLEHYMHTKPESQEQKYIFLTDTRELAFAIIGAGYPAILFDRSHQGYLTPESFKEYMQSISCTGTYQSDYIYVISCSEQQTNQSLEQFFQAEYLTFRKGWSLFYKK